MTNKAGNWRGLVELQIGYLNIRLPGLLPIETHAPVPRHGPPPAERVFGYWTCGRTAARRPPLIFRAGEFSHAQVGSGVGGLLSVTEPGGSAPVTGELVRTSADRNGRSSAQGCTDLPPFGTAFGQPTGRHVSPPAGQLMRGERASQPPGPERGDRACQHCRLTADRRPGQPPAAAIPRDTERRTRPVVAKPHQPATSRTVFP